MLLNIKRLFECFLLKEQTKEELEAMITVEQEKLEDKLERMRFEEREIKDSDKEL